MHFGAAGIVPVNMYQSFEMEIRGERLPININKGYILTNKAKHPEIMTPGFFKQNKGVQLQDFLFVSKKSIGQDFIGEEVIEVPAGSLKAQHYRKKRNGQIIDFWISPEAGSISLVKLVSKNKTSKEQNYKIELTSIIEDVLPSIDPKLAKPMSLETKKTFKIKD